MAMRYDKTPPWGKKRKREPSPSSNSSDQSTSPPPANHQDDKHLHAASHDPQRRPTPWAKYSDPLSPSSLAPLSETDQAGDDDDLRRAAKDMFDWTRSDRPAEESLSHMEHIVHVCQDEASWSGDKRWNKVVAAYKSCGASPDAVHDLKDAREPFWTQCRVKHASTTLATPKALADSIRTMLAESERVNGHYLGREAKNYLIKAVERLFPRTQRKIWTLDGAPKPSHSESPRQNPVLVAPVAHMIKNDNPSPQSLVSTAPQQAPPAPSDPRLVSRPPRWAAASDRETKPRADYLADPASSRKSSAATLTIQSPLQSAHASPRPSSESSHLVKPTHAPIQFNLATGLNRVPPKRPRLELDVSSSRKPTDSVFSTPSSPERRGSSALGNNFQPPTGPRSLPRFQAKIIPKEPLGNEAKQKQQILQACDHSRIPAQDANPCSSDHRTWILHFKDLRDLQTSLGKPIFLHDISTPVLTHAPYQSFQVFGIVEKPSFLTQQVETEIIKAIARTLHPAKFILRRQDSQNRNLKYTLKWIVVFEEPLALENLILDVKINERRDVFEFFGLECSGEVKRCWVCSGTGHFAPSCADYTEVVKLPYRDSHYLWKTPQLK
jgi:hypothetical protein